MKLIMTCNGEENISYAIVQIDEALARTIAQRGEALRSLKTADNEVSCIEYAVGHVYFYEATEALEEALDGASEAFVGDEFEPGAEDEHTDCDTLVVTDNHVWWTCYAHHGDVLCQTGPVSYGEIAEAVTKSVAASVTPIAAPARRAPYEAVIKPVLERMKRVEIDPRHVEAYIRDRFHVLDGLSRADFSREVRKAVKLIDQIGTAEAEANAQSHGY